jgi:hypothetical protein
VKWAACTAHGLADMPLPIPRHGELPPAPRSLQMRVLYLMIPAMGDPDRDENVYKALSDLLSKKVT